MNFQSRLSFFSILFFTVIATGLANPKKYTTENGSFQPINRYYETNLPSPANNSAKIDHKEGKDASSDRLRFGISNYGSTGSGTQYGHNTGYGVSPMKIDIGGVALGALIGLGAILILPKLSHLFSGGYGYRRLENDMSSVTDVLARIDNSLEQHNIDSSSCMQRVICTYVSGSLKNVETGEANSVDEFVLSLSNNALFSYMLDGTAIKAAVDMAKKGDTEKCESLVTKCPISKENITKVIASLLPA